MALSLNVPYIFHAVGGPAALLSLLRQQEPTRRLKYATVQMWWMRRTIAGAWIVPVLCLMTRRGHDMRHLFMDADDPFSDVDLERQDRDMVPA